jgi:hypothetical protein
MCKDDELVGIIAIYRQEVRPFTDKQIELLDCHLFNFDPQQPDNIFFLEDDASAAKPSDARCGFRFHWSSVHT